MRGDCTDGELSGGVTGALMDPPCMYKCGRFGILEEVEAEDEADDRFFSHGMRELPSAPLVILPFVIKVDDAGLAKVDEDGLGL